MQPGEFKQFIADPDVARYYQRFPTGTNGICQQEENLNIEVVSSVVWTKHGHLNAAN